MVRRLIFLFSLGAIGAFFFRTYTFEGIYIASGSMAPTLPVDFHVIVNKMAYLFSEPKRGDVIMFDSPIDSNKGLVKRIVGVGGDVLEIRAKRVYINNKRLDEPYAHFQKPETMFEGDNIEPIQIPKGAVFVMGDNRDFSGDSRDWFNADKKWIPFLPVKKIKGRVQKYEFTRPS